MPKLKIVRKKRVPNVSTEGFNPGTPFIKQKVSKPETVVNNTAVEKREQYIYIPKENDIEGVNYLNISKHSSLDVGKELNPGFGFKFNTPFGKAGSVRNFMEYVVTPNYPIEALRKTKLTQQEITKLPKKKVNVTNYWAIVATAILTRIKDDEQLVEKLKAIPDNCRITSFNKFKSDFGGTITESIVPNIKMRSYIDIIKFIVKQLKTYNINDKEVVDKVITTFSNDKTVDLFHKCPVPVKTKK